MNKEKLKIEERYLTKNRCYKAAKKRTAIGIQIHTIGTGQGTAQAVADYWNQASVSACVHYIVDCDENWKVLQTLPEFLLTRPSRDVTGNASVSENATVHFYSHVPRGT